MREFGIQIYSVRDKTGTKEGIESTFKALRAMGYTQIQTAGTPAVSYEEYGRMAAEAGLEIIGTHDDFNMMCTDFEQALANHRALNTKLMGIGGTHPKAGNEDIAGWEEIIEKINQVAAKCGEHGMKFTYHNHSHEFIRLANGKTPMEMLMERMDPVNTSFVLDTYWVQHGGGDICGWIEKLAGRIDILHLKDMMRLPRFDEKNGYQMNIEVGSGNLDWPRILKAAEKAGVKYYVVEMDSCAMDSLESMRISSEYLKTLI